MQVRDKYQEFAFRINLAMHLTNSIRQVEYTPAFGVDSMNLSFNSYCSLSLSFSRLSTAYFYLFSLCYFQTVNSKNLELKTWRVRFMPHFLTFKFSDTALKFSEYYFQSILTNLTITQF